MYMSEQKFNKIKERHDTLLIMDVDVSEAFEFVHDLLEAEAAALKEKCPYATKSITETERAAHYIFDVRREIENEQFGDGD